MLTLEQFADKELAELFSKQYFNEPMLYQSGVLQMMILQGKMKAEDANVMALQFYAPIHLLLTVCDREPAREQEALEMLEKHIRQFNTNVVAAPDFEYLAYSEVYYYPNSRVTASALYLIQLDSGLSKKEAICEIHIPTDVINLKKARQRLKYEEKFLEEELADLDQCNPPL